MENNIYGGNTGRYLKTVITLLLIVLVGTLSTYSDRAKAEMDNICVGSFSISEIPDFSDKAYVEINGNKPYFQKPVMEDYYSFEKYGEMDALGRCTAASACIGTDLMAMEARGNLGAVTPTGWQTVKYEFIPGGYLYNRCHLIGFQLTGENANENNLITGTRYLNTSGMLPFENMVADYIKETNNHVLYRVTPVFIGNELLARGLIMEALSAEDDGDGICFCVYVYNCQPGIKIDYLTGNSSVDEKSGYEIPTRAADSARCNKEVF